MSSGYGTFLPGSFAVAQKSAKASNNKWMNGKLQLCWRCQKDKPLKGGQITMLGGQTPGAVRKFICADCIEEKQAKLAGGEA